MYVKQFVCALLTLLVTNAMSQGKFKIEHQYSLNFPMFPSSVTYGGVKYERLGASLVAANDRTGPNVQKGIGLQVEVPVTTKLSLRLGGELIGRNFIGYLASSCENCYPNDQNQMHFDQQYADVPLTVRYYLIAKHLIVFAEAGAVANFLLVQNAYWKKSESMGKEWSKQPIKGVEINDKMFGMTAGAGVGYATTKRIDLILSVNYRRVLTEYTAGDDYKPHAVVVNLGIAYRFGKSAP